MKKPHVLNRAMFNQGGTSAYGRGITSNLVSDEQRQRFNYGGRVGYVNRGLVAPLYPSGVTPTKLGGSFDEQEAYRVLGDPVNLEEKFKEWYEIPEFSDTDPSQAVWGGSEFVEPKKVRRKEFIESSPERFTEEFESWKEDRGKKYVEQKEKEDLIRSSVEGTEKPDEPILKPEVLTEDTESDVLGAGTDWEKFAEGLYDKKGAKGKAQLELAGNVLAAAFQPKKEAMAILGKGLGDFGKTASARKEKMEDIAATGKMYDKIYKTRAIEKGKQARLTALDKIKTGNPWTDYQAALLSLKDKDDAIDFATGETVRTLTLDTKTKEVEMPSDGIPGQLFKHPTTKEYFLIDQDGKPQPINLNKYLKNLKLA